MKIRPDVKGRCGRGCTFWGSRTKLMRWSKAQLSLEFAFVTIILLFLTILVVLVSGNKLTDFKNEKDIFLLKDIAATVRNEIQVAYAMDSGYVRSFDLPETLDGQDYTISIQNNFISAAMGDEQIELATQLINGTLAHGTNVIRKVGGNVLLN